LVEPETSRINKLLSAGGIFISAACAAVGAISAVEKAVKKAKAKTVSRLWIRIGGTLKDLSVFG
jgi:hypothetical protein